MAEHNYIEAPVTIDNAEYLFARAYAIAHIKNQPKRMEKLGNTYIAYMADVVEHYERKSQDLFGRNINHILLIHANLLNTHYLEKLIKMLQTKGYSFISQEAALVDPAYEHPVTSYGDWGISWIDRWALSEGKSKDFYRDEPRVPEFVSNPK
ncbi:hypothetical protein E1176_04160 [Fulvivirga sp. RKSG066]|nr:hypothetical protein [Fulvivirga aurantia]